MIDRASAGPAGSAQWQERTIGMSLSQPVTLLLLPDAANAAPASQPLYYYLPQIPQLAWATPDSPAFSLTLVLSRQPSPIDETIQPLIERGVLSTTLTLAPIAPVLAELTADASAEYQPLFAQTATFWIEINGREISGSQVAAIGANPQASLSFSLDRDNTLEVLSALDGIADNVTVRIQISYRTAATQQTIRLSGSWAAIHNFLGGEAGKEFSNAELQHHFAELLKSQVIAAFQVTRAGDVALQNPDVAFPIFLRTASVILQRITPELGLQDVGNRYVLRNCPSPLFRLSYQQTVSGYGQQAIDLSAALPQVIGNALVGLERSRYVHLIAPSLNNGGGMSPVPRRIRSDRRTQRRSIADSRMQLVAAQGTIESLALAMKPDRRIAPAAHAIVASDLAKPLRAHDALHQHWQIEDAVFCRPPDLNDGEEIISLPVVGDPEAAVWHDRLNTSQYWYLPVDELVMPAPNADAATSPFRFTYAQAGVTADGKPALTGTVQFTLRQVMRPETQAALQAAGNPIAYPVPILSRSVLLEIPFVDTQTGAQTTSAFTAKLESQGDTLLATIELLNDWVRLCYGALAYPNFQGQPARLNITSTYAAYVVVRGHEFNLVYGAKTAVTPIDYAINPVENTAVASPYLHAATATLRLPNGALQFQREVPRHLAAARIAPFQSVMLQSQVTQRIASEVMLRADLLEEPIAPARASIEPPVLRPELEPAPIVANYLKRIRYVQQTMARQTRTDALFPCSTYGAFYLHSTSDRITAIGCQDVLRLGEIAYRQYEELVELRHSLYWVYRSLQQPGQFLVLPTRYRITRYAASMGEKAYRAAILMFTVVDKDTHQDLRIAVEATMQPDLPPYARKELLVKLASSARTPTLIFPTETASQTAYTWTAGEGVQILPLNTGDSFQVRLNTSDDNNALLLKTLLEKSGVYGRVTFTLPDRTELVSDLALELSQLTGPWQGAIEVDLSNSGIARLTNKIERPVHVSDLLVYGEAIGQSVRVDQTLAVGQFCEISLPAAAIEVHPVYVEQPGTPASVQEIPIFVEDIYTNVLFLDLVHYGNHGLQSLEVEVRVKGNEQISSLRFTGSDDQRVAEASVTFPLTEYLTDRTIEFRVRKTLTTGVVVETPWCDWNLTTQGNLIGIHWSMIQ